MAFFHLLHCLDHGDRTGAVQPQVHGGERGGRAVGAEVGGECLRARKMNGPAFPKAKVVRHNNFLTAFVDNCLKGKQVRSSLGISGHRRMIYNDLSWECTL